MNSFYNQENQWDFKETAKYAKSKRGKTLLIILAVFLILWTVLQNGYTILMEYWQIQEIGQQYTDVFWTNFFAKILTQTVGFVLIFAILTANLFIVKKIALERVFSASLIHKKWPYLLAGLVISFSLSGFLGGSLYEKLLLAANATEFGTFDPLYSKDIGYYMFTRPFLISISGGAKTLLLVVSILTAVLYFVLFVKKGHRSIKEVILSEKGAIIHVATLGILYFLFSLLTYTFSAENLLYASFGADIAGAGYVETHIWRNYYRIAPVIVIISVALVIFFLYKKSYIKALSSLLLVPAVFIVFAIVSVGVETLVVSPNERALQTPHIQRNIEATKKAYNLDTITETEFIPRYDLSQEELLSDDTWLAGTRIADYGATLTAYNQLQFLRKYYSFYDVDVAPYTLNDRLNVVFLAARELNKDNLDANARSYANKTFRYTHGFGVVASPVNRVTYEGQPEFLVKDIPPQSTGGMPAITQPRIYYGELTDDYVIVGGNNKELDYSEGLEDIEFTYDGDAGIELSFFKRLLFSLYYRDYRMLVSGNISNDSRILINRSVLPRVQKAAPFLSFDTDPYLIITDTGKLCWVINGYTLSSQYPYAQSYGNFNYIRNSVLATVDAYTGAVSFYIIDKQDPVIKTYAKIYPSLFAKEPLPEEIANHIRVPEFLFKVQTEIYQSYHVNDGGQFYDKADVWDIAHEKYQDNEISMEPYYNIMEIEGQNEMVLMRPFVVQGKHNMVGLLVQRNSKDHYGELILYRFPKNETVYGPLQIENRIDNDPDISREMTLWGQGGSSVIRGNILVVPYRDALLYIEPIYITSKNNASLPELKRIVVAYKDGIAMDQTLEGALKTVFSEASPGETIQVPENEPIVDIPTEEVTDLAGVIQKVIDEYDALQSSTSARDWQAMGESMEGLGEAVEALREQSR